MVELTFYDVQQRRVYIKETSLGIVETIPLWVVKHWNYSHKQDTQSRLSYIMSRVGRQGGIDWIYKNIKPFVMEYYERTNKTNVNKVDLSFQPYLEFRSDLKERMMKWEQKQAQLLELG